MTRKTYEFTQRRLDGMAEHTEPKQVIEVRVITHVPNPPAAYVALLFNDGTSSSCLREFANYEAAELFADGIRAGLDWVRALNGEKHDEPHHAS